MERDCALERSQTPPAQLVYRVAFLETVGILDIIYLFFFAKKKMTIEEIKHWFQKTFFRRTESK